MDTPSRCSSVDPASMRDSSSRSITIWSNRRTWVTTTSSACWVRSGRSARRPSSTSTAAESAVMGERSSWLTSLAKRASRSSRAWTASAMSLNEVASRARSGSPPGAIRASRPPSAISPAAWATRVSGRRSRRFVHHPMNPAMSAVTAAPTRRAVAMAPRVAIGGLEREALEVQGVELGDVDARTEEGFTVRLESLQSIVAGGDVRDAARRGAPRSGTERRRRTIARA